MPFSAQSWYAFAVPVQEFAPGIPSKSTLHALPSFKQPRVFEFGVHHHLSEGPAKEHFDLRLGDPETGHAHSWALKYLPKPGERRLAVQQPTHTVGYMDFKGRIEGGYGKGQVNLLRRDRAEVLRSSPDSVRFNIYGGKDVEEYSLSRMKDRNWLIQNVTTTRASGLLPSSKPSYKEVPEHRLGIEDPKTELQAKIDGAHVLYQFKDPGSLPRVLSYRPTERLTGVIEHTHKLPDFHALRTPGALKDTILRGELYATDHAGKALPAARVGGILNAGVWKSREKQSAEGTLKPVVFDVVRWRGTDVESAPYAKKREMLQQAIKAAPWLSLPRRASTPAEKRKLLEDIKTGREPSTEEGVVEWHEDRSVPGKTKFLAEQDVHVRGVFKEKGTRNLAGGFEFSRSPDGPIVGRVGTGMSHEMKKDMLAQPEKYVGLKARIQAQRAPAHYAPRAPSFLSFHLDQELPEGVKMSSAWLKRHEGDYQAFLEMVKNARVKEAKTRSVKQWQAAETSDPALAKSIEQFYGREGTATEAPFSRRLEAYKQWKAQGGVGQRPVPTGPQGLGLSERQLKDISIGGAETGVDLTMGRLHPSQLSEVVPRHAQEMQSQARVRKLWKPDATAVAAEEVPAHLSQKMHTTERILGMPGNEDAAAKMYAHGKTPYGNVSYHEYVRGAQALPHPDDLRAAGASPAAVQAAEDARFNLASQVQKQVADPLRAQGIHLADVPSVHLGAPTRAGVLPYEATGNFANVPLVKGKPKILDFMVHQEGTRNPGVLFPLEETGQYGSITSSPSRVGSSFMETGAKGSERRALNDLRKAHFRGVMPEIESAATRAQHMAGMRSAATKLWEHAPSWVPRRTAPITPGAAPMMEQLGDVATRVFKKVAGAQDDQATGHPYLGAALGTGLGLTGLVAASPTLRANAKSILRSIRQGKLIGARGAEAAAELPPEVMLQAEQMAKHLRAAGFDPKKHSIAVGATGATGKSTTARALAKALGVTHRELDDAYSHGGLGLSGLNLQRYLEKNPIAPGTVAEQNLLLNQADPEKFFAMVHLEKPIEKIREQALKRGRSAFQLDVMDYPHMQKSIRTAFEQAQGPMHEIAPGLRMKIRGPEGFKAQETLESKARELGFDPTGLSREQLVRSVALGSRSTGAGDLAYIHKPRVALGTGVLAAGGLGGAELGSQLAGDDSTKLGYKLQGHDNFQGLPIAIENKKGDVRKGVDRDGHKWRTVMKYPYGYIEGTKAKDGEGVDAYVGPKRDAAHAYVVHQHKPDGTGFDEDKVMLGFDSEEAARKAYLKQYDDPKFLGPISRVPMEELRELVKSHKKLEKISMSKAVAR